MANIQSELNAFQNAILGEEVRRPFITALTKVNDEVEYLLAGGGGSPGGAGDMTKAVYDINLNGIVDNAEKVNGYTVSKSVPSNAVFTDTVYTHPAEHLASMITTSATRRFVTDTQISEWNAKQSALGYVAENTNNKGIANGYASLDNGGKVPLAQLPTIPDGHTHTNKAILDKITTGAKASYNLDQFTTFDDISNLGGGDMVKAIYDTNNSGVVDNSEKVGGYTVQKNVPLDAVFTDTIYIHPETHPASMILTSNDRRFVTDVEKSTWTGKQNSLGFTPEDNSKKGVANGYAGLDATGKVPSAQLPNIDGHTHSNKTILDKITTGTKTSYNLDDFLTSDDITGGGDMLKSVYDTNNTGIVDNSEKVSGFTVGVNVPSNAKFTDTVYSHPTNHPASMITESLDKQFISDTQKTVWNNKWDYNEATIKNVKVNNASDADTVTGKTVGANVPAGAVFTDTVTTINNKTGAIGKADIVALGIPAQDTTYDFASKADKTQVLTDVPVDAVFTDTVTTINGKTGVIEKSDIVDLGIPAQDTTYTAGDNIVITGNQISATTGSESITRITPSGGDDTQLINDAITAASLRTSSKYVILDGEFIVSALNDWNPAINMKSGVVLEFANEASITLTPNNFSSSSVIRCDGIVNWEIKNPKIIGDRVGHTGTEGEYGHGIEVRGECKNWKIIDAYVEQTWGDGLYIGSGTDAVGGIPEDGFVSRIETYKTSRNGVSISSCKRLRIQEIKASYSDRTEPKAGVQIETDRQNEFWEDLYIGKVQTYHCSRGVWIFPYAMRLYTEPTYNTIRIDDISCYGNNPSDCGGVTINNIKWEVVKGKIKIGNVYVEHSDVGALDITDVVNDGFQVEVDSVSVGTTHQSPLGINKDGVIRIDCFNYADSKNVGDILIKEVNFKGTGRYMLNLLGQYTGTNYEKSKLRIGKVNKGLVTIPNRIDGNLDRFTDNVLNELNLADLYNIYNPGNTWATFHFSGSLYHNEGRMTGNWIRIKGFLDRVYNTPIILENREDSVAFGLYNSATFNLYPESTNPVCNGIESTEKGARITLQMDELGDVYILDMIGTWTRIID